MSLTALMLAGPCLAQPGSTPTTYLSFTVTVTAAVTATGTQSCTFEGVSFSTTTTETITNALKDGQDFGALVVYKQTDNCTSLFYGWVASGLPLVSVDISERANINGDQQELLRLSISKPTFVAITSSNQNNGVVEILKFDYDNLTFLDSPKSLVTMKHKTPAAPVKYSSLSITTTGLSAGAANKAYSQTLAATGGTGPYIWTVVVGRLPTGLTLNSSTGEISGTPNVPQVATVTFQATDSSSPPQTATAPLTLIIN